MNRRLTPLDLAFFALESASRPMHAGAILLFDPPAGGNPAELIEDTFATFRQAEPTGHPWNARPVLGLGIPHWETVEVDMDYHVRRVSLPAPGSTDQLMALLSHLYPAPLDQSRPLWEAYLVEGLESGQMGIFIKAHHAMFDGVSGARVFYRSFSTQPNDDPRPVWVEPPPPVEDRQRPTPDAALSGYLGKVVTLLTGVAGAAPQLVKLVPDVIRLARSGTAVPFTAARTSTMAEQISSARSFAFFDLPLDEVKAVGKQFGGTVNDVVLSVCDEAMHRYLAETDGHSPHSRLVACMAVSTRRAGDAPGNAAAATLVPLGTPQSSSTERLAQIVAVTTGIKSGIRQASALPLQLQTLAVMSGTELRERLPGVARETVPLLSNFAVSNVAGPDHELYLGRAKLAGLYTLPIVNGSQAANFTLLPVHRTLCVGIGAARNLLPDTSRLARLAQDSFAALRDAVNEPGSA